MDFAEALERLGDEGRDVLRVQANRTATFQPNQVMAEALADAGEVPEWVQLTPKRGNFAGRDGRRFKVSNAREIVKLFTQSGEHLQVDIDHQSEFAGLFGTTKAYGWVTQMAVRNGGEIWARIEWTPEGSQLVSERQFRGLSPVFRITEESAMRRYEDPEAVMEVESIVSVALTNRPNLRLVSLNTQESPAPEEKEPDMRMEAILEALGLAADSSETVVLNSIGELKGRASHDLSKFVPRADYDVAVAQANAAKAELASGREANHRVAVDAAITDALKSGKISPASESYHRECCKTEAGLAAFTSFIKEAAPIVAANKEVVKDTDPTPAPGPGLSDHQRQLCQRLGIPEDKFLAELTHQQNTGWRAAKATQADKRDIA